MAYVRLHPHLPKQGYKARVRTFTDSKGYVHKFHEERGWYEIDSVEVTKALREMPQEKRFPLGPKAFLVADTREEASQMEASLMERLTKVKAVDVKVGTVEDPVPLRPGTKVAEAPRTRKRQSKKRESFDD